MEGPDNLDRLYQARYEVQQDIETLENQLARIANSPRTRRSREEKEFTLSSKRRRLETIDAAIKREITGKSIEAVRVEKPSAFSWDFDIVPEDELAFSGIPQDDGLAPFIVEEEVQAAPPVVAQSQVPTSPVSPFERGLDLVSESAEVVADIMKQFRVQEDPKLTIELAKIRAEAAASARDHQLAMARLQADNTRFYTAMSERRRADFERTLRELV